MPGGPEGQRQDSLVGLPERLPPVGQHDVDRIVGGGRERDALACPQPLSEFSLVIGPPAKRSGERERVDAGPLGESAHHGRSGTAELVERLPWVADQRGGHVGRQTRVKERDVEFVGVESLVDDDCADGSLQSLTNTGEELDIGESTEHDRPNLVVGAHAAGQRVAEGRERGPGSVFGGSLLRDHDAALLQLHTRLNSCALGLYGSPPVIADGQVGARADPGDVAVLEQPDEYVA